jgi:hypothetical protein
LFFFILILDPRVKPEDDRVVKPEDDRVVKPEDDRVVKFQDDMLVIPSLTCSSFPA